MYHPVQFPLECVYVIHAMLCTSAMSWITPGRLTLAAFISMLHIQPLERGIFKIRLLSMSNTHMHRNLSDSTPGYNQKEPHTHL
jgi:hypothetical protein